MIKFKDFLKEEQDHYYIIHGGSDFDQVDPKKYGTGEPGNIRPLGKGLYGYVLDPNNKEEAHGAINWAKRYSQKYARHPKTLHIFKIPKTTIGSYGYKKFIDLPSPRETGKEPQIRSTRLPIDQTEVAVLDHSILTRVAKHPVDTPNEDILKGLK